MTRIYQIEKDITQVCDADFSQDMGFYYYGLNGEDVAVYEVEDIDNISEAEVSAVNEKVKKIQLAYQMKMKPWNMRLTTQSAMES